MIKHVLQKSVSKLKEILQMLTSIGEVKLVSSIREKIYQVEKEKKVERRKAKEAANNPEPVFKEVKEPEVEKVVDSGEVKATPKPVSKKKGRKKKESQMGKKTKARIPKGIKVFLNYLKTILNKKLCKRWTC